MIRIDFGNITGGILAVDDATSEALTAAQVAEVERITAQKRKRERMAAYRLLNAIFGEGAMLTHDANGAPAVVGEEAQVSVSHSSSYAAVVRAEFPVGVDIETVSLRPLRIVGKYLDDDEIQRLQPDTERVATVAWTIKEAVFKAAQEPDLVLTGIKIVEMNEGGDAIESLAEVGERRFRSLTQFVDSQCLTVAFEVYSERYLRRSGRRRRVRSRARS